MTTASITSVATEEFWPPRQPLQDQGLFLAIGANDGWVKETGEGPDRFAIGGVRVRTINYGADGSSGVWNAPWCGDADPDTQIKNGARPSFPDIFEPIHVWAWDACDPTSQSRDYVRENATQWLQISEQNDVETAFATRLLNDAGTLPSTADFIAALGALEVAIAKTRIQAYIHASPRVAAQAAFNQVLLQDDHGQWHTPLGSMWVFGGGYDGLLDDTLVATSQPYGWRGAIALTEAMIEPDHGAGTASTTDFAVVAERSFAVGYEKLIGAVQVTLS